MHKNLNCLAGFPFVDGFSSTTEIWNRSAPDVWHPKGHCDPWYCLYNGRPFRC